MVRYIPGFLAVSIAIKRKWATANIQIQPITHNHHFESQCIYVLLRSRGAIMYGAPFAKARII